MNVLWVQQSDLSSGKWFVESTTRTPKCASVQMFMYIFKNYLLQHYSPYKFRLENSKVKQIWHLNKQELLTINFL